MPKIPTIRYNARIIDVARYLGVDRADVRRMMRLDKLPAVKVPGPSRPLFRVPLRAFHAWLVAREVNDGMTLAGGFAEFLEDFHQATRGEATASNDGEGDQ